MIYVLCIYVCIYKKYMDIWTRDSGPWNLAHIGSTCHQKTRLIALT